MLSRLSPPATSAPLPLTYLLLSDDLIRETQLGFAWSDALAALWTGDFDGTPRLICLDIAAGKATESLNAALINLADRAHVEGEAPKHLWPLFDAAGLDYPIERSAKRYRSPMTGPMRVGSVFAR